MHVNARRKESSIHGSFVSNERHVWACSHDHVADVNAGGEHSKMLESSCHHTRTFYKLQHDLRTGEWSVISPTIVLHYFMEIQPFVLCTLHGQLKLPSLLTILMYSRSRHFEFPTCDEAADRFPLLSTHRRTHFTPITTESWERHTALILPKVRRVGLDGVTFQHVFCS